MRNDVSINCSRCVTVFGIFIKRYLTFIMYIIYLVAKARAEVRGILKHSTSRDLGFISSIRSLHMYSLRLVYSVSLQNDGKDAELLTRK